MEFLYMLEKIRIPVLNEFMLLITRLGEETTLLVLALIVFWCVDKYKGYYILGVSFLGVLVNQFMKLWFRIPRPWVLDENFTCLEDGIEAATGYSFPSGHTQSAVGTFGCIAVTAKRKWMTWLCICVMILVPFSRMYIGVHTPKDVVVAALIALILVVVLKSLVMENDHKYLPVVLGIMVLCAFAYFCFVKFYNFPADIDEHNMLSGLENAYTLLGSVLGLVVVYIVDEKWIHISTKATWWIQIIKVAVGLLLVLAVKVLLEQPLNLLLGEMLGRTARYFLLVIVAGSVWPLSFKWLAKIGNKE